MDEASTITVMDNGYCDFTTNANAMSTTLGKSIREGEAGD